MFIQALELKDFLSFRDVAIELGPINLLIGPNGSGKSNLIDALDFLRHCPGDLSSFILNEGGATQWIRRADRVAQSSIDGRYSNGSIPLTYSVTFMSQQGALRVIQESLHQTLEDGKIDVFERSSDDFAWHPIYDVYEFLKVGPGKLRSSQTFLSQFRVPNDPTPITALAKRISDVAIYRGFDTDKKSPIRQGVMVSGDDVHLSERGTNLAYILHLLDTDEGLDRLNEFLVEFAPHYHGVKPKFVNNRWTIQLRESGLDSPTPTERISEGTLKFLCLLSILLDPNPAPLICLEEPEVGLHPEAIALISRAMEIAEERSQLIVTTHSQALVDRFSDRPDAIIVCEKDADNATTLNRQSETELASWLEDYTLGNLWQRGVLGGNRR